MFCVIFINFLFLFQFDSIQLFARNRRQLRVKARQQLQFAFELSLIKGGARIPNRVNGKIVRKCGNAEIRIKLEN